MRRRKKSSFKILVLAGLAVAFLAGASEAGFIHLPWLDRFKLSVMSALSGGSSGETVATAPTPDSPDLVPDDSDAEAVPPPPPLPEAAPILPAPDGVADATLPHEVTGEVLPAAVDEAADLVREFGEDVVGADIILGAIHLTGRLGRADTSEGAAWIGKAADAGNPYGLYLRLRLMEDRVLPLNLDIATDDATRLSALLAGNDRLKERAAGAISRLFLAAGKTAVLGSSSDAGLNVVKGTAEAEEVLHVEARKSTDPAGSADESPADQPEGMEQGGEGKSVTSSDNPPMSAPETSPEGSQSVADGLAHGLLSEIGAVRDAQKGDNESEAAADVEPTPVFESATIDFSAVSEARKQEELLAREKAAAEEKAAQEAKAAEEKRIAEEAAAKKEAEARAAAEAEAKRAEEAAARKKAEEEKAKEKEIAEERAAEERARELREAEAKARLALEQKIARQMEEARAKEAASEAGKDPQGQKLTEIEAGRKDGLEDFTKMVAAAQAERAQGGGEVAEDASGAGIEAGTMTNSKGQVLTEIPQPTPGSALTQQLAAAGNPVAGTRQDITVNSGGLVLMAKGKDPNALLERVRLILAEYPDEMKGVEPEINSVMDQDGPIYVLGFRGFKSEASMKRICAVFGTRKCVLQRD